MTEPNYKEMWLSLKSKVEALRQEARAKADNAEDYGNLKELVAIQGWMDTVLRYMKEEEER